MLDVQAAIDVVLKERPFGVIKTWISYKDDYVFVVYDKRSVDSFFDPYVAVDKNTGIFREFSIYTDGDTAELVNLFRNSIPD